MYVHVYEQDNRKKNVECLPVTAEETGEPPWRVRPALGSAVGRCVSWGITECQGGKPTFSRGLLKTQPLSLGRVSTVDCSPAATAAANSLQSCPTLCHPIDGSPPGSPVPGTLQARILERGAIAFSDNVIKRTKIRKYAGKY